MPGGTVWTTATLLVTVGDGTSFPTAAHLASYAGLAPTTKSSGTSIHGEHAPRDATDSQHNRMPSGHADDNWRDISAGGHSPDTTGEGLPPSPAHNRPTWLARALRTASLFD